MDSAMPGGERFFVTAIRDYCTRHDITIDVRAGGWLIAMRRGSQRHFALGYDIGLNSSIAHRLANDKSATAEVLALADLPCVPHHFFLDPAVTGQAAGSAWRRPMHDLLAQNPQGVVVKPNEGTAGRNVFKVTSREEFDQAVDAIFARIPGLVISPYVTIEDEVRVVLLDGAALVVYSKERGSDWRHNLDHGARPLLLDRGTVRDTCAKLARDAATAIGIDFASVDLVRTDGAWRVLEINSGVMMEKLGELHPELARATYDAALDRVFGEVR